MYMLKNQSYSHVHPTYIACKKMQKSLKYGYTEQFQSHAMQPMTWLNGEL
jgi:hypothetical protein